MKATKTFFALFILIVMLFEVNAQDSIQAREYINKLTAPEMHGRGYAYNGDSIAADYIREQFKRIGLEPFAANDYYNRTVFQCYAMEGPITAQLNGKTLTPWQQFSLAPYSATAHQTFFLLPVSAEVLIDDDLLKAFCNKNQKVIASSLLYLDQRKCKDKEVWKKVQWLLYRLSSRSGQFPFKGFVVGTDNIPVWSFNAAHHQCDYVLAYLKSDCKVKKGSQLTLSYDNELRLHHTQNVCAMIRGSERPDSLVIIGGHYDHLGQMGDAVIFPGAHDNASGTAAVLDMAQHFKKHTPRYTTIFVLFCGEEAGLLGSKQFVRDSLFDFSKVKLMLNLDLMCGGDDGFTVVNADGANTKSYYQALVDRNNELHWVKEVKPRKNANISDHAPFIEKGMPAVFIYTMGGQTGGYHQPDDTSGNASLSYYERIVKLLLYGIESL